MQNINSFKVIFGTLPINKDSKLPFWENFLEVNGKAGQTEYLMISYKTFLKLAYKDYKKCKQKMSFEEFIKKTYPKKNNPEGLFKT